MPRLSARLAITVATLAAIGLAGCATGRAPDAKPTETPAPLAVTVPMPDLGPAPPRDQLTDEQVEAIRVQGMDAAWERVLTAYPNAVRPDVHFARYSTTEDYTEVMSACFTEMGVPFKLGTDMYGKASGMEWTTDVEEHAVGVYICQVMHPNRPLAPPKDAQLAWVYDYLTQFLVPCYEANGIENPPPPSKEDFVANWSNGGWFPGTGDFVTDTDKERSLFEACPQPAF